MKSFAVMSEDSTGLIFLWGLAMAIPIECKSCGKKARVPDNAAGKKIRCPKCNSVIQVPDSGKKKSG